MSDIMLSKEMVDEYIKSLDQHDANIQRIIGGLQSLHPRLLEELFAILISGKADIKELYQYQINDISIDTFIKGINFRTTHEDNITTSGIIKKIQSLPTYKHFLEEVKLDSKYRLNRIVQPPIGYFTKVEIDTMGLKRDAKYRNVVSVQNVYNKVILDYDLMQIKQLVLDKVKELDSPNMLAFTNYLMNKVANLYLVYSEDNMIRDESSQGGFLVWLLKRQYIDIGATNSNEFMVDIANGMLAIAETIVVHNDPLYSDLVTRYIDNLIATKPYEKCFANSRHSNEAGIMKDFQRLVFALYVLPNRMYGSSYIDSAKLDTLAEEHRKIMEWLEAFSIYLNSLSKKLKEVL